MRRKILSVFLTLVLFLTACGPKGPTWQEQYDLGVKYLTEGNYSEAIIAFTAAIEIDQKQPSPYSGRGQAYALSGDTEDNLAAAQADFEQAIALDETFAEAWLGLADVYIRRGEYDKALEVLKDALDKTGNDQTIADKIAEMEAGTFADTSGRTRKSCYYENGQLIQYWLYDYDEKGNNIETRRYNSDDTLDGTLRSEFNEKNQEIRESRSDVDGHTSVVTYKYDESGRRVREDRDDGGYTLISYDDAARTQTHDAYDENGALLNHFVIEHDEANIRRKGSNYRPDENGQLYLDYYVEYIWNEDGSYGGFTHFQVAPRNEEG